MKYTLLLVFFINTSLFGKEDTLLTLKGKVFDSKGSILVGASVFIEGHSGKGTVSGIDGFYEIKQIPKGIYRVSCTYIGFKKHTVVLSIKRSNESYNFYLKPKSFQLKQIDVISNKGIDLKKGGAGFSEMNKEDIDKHSGQTFAETMKALVGLTVLQTGPSISKPVIRGLSAQRIVILTDNVKQHAQQWGEEHAPAIDPFLASKIEVVKGASAIEYAANAIGGAIKVEALSLEYEKPFVGKATLNFFSNNLQPAFSIEAKGAIPFVPSTFSWQTQISGRIAGDAVTPTYSLTNTAFREINFLTGIGWKKDNLEMSLRLTRFATELGIYSQSHTSSISSLIQIFNDEIDRTSKIEPYYNILFPKQQIEHLLVSFNFSYYHDDFGKIQATYGWQQNTRNEYDLHVGFRLATPDDPPAFKLFLWTNSLSASFSHLPLGNFIGKIGLNAKLQHNINGGKSALIPNFIAYELGAFLKESWFTKKVNISLGARYDFRRYEIKPYRMLHLDELFEASPDLRTPFFSSLFSVIGDVVYLITENQSLGLNVSLTSRSPTVNELYSEGIHHGSARYEKGNYTLDVERSIGAELIYRAKTDFLESEISLYGNIITNYIQLFPLTYPQVTIRGVFPAFEYKQSNVVMFGIDAFGEIRLTDWLEVNAKISSVFAFTLEDFFPLYHIPPPQAMVTFHLDLPDFFLFKKNYIEISSDVYVKQYFVPTITSDVMPSLIASEKEYKDYLRILSTSPNGYAKMNISVGTAMQIDETELSLSLTVDDLLNLPYRSYMSRFRFYANNVGRNIILRLSILI